jgi:hypothetical protein
VYACTVSLFLLSASLLCSISRSTPVHYATVSLLHYDTVDYEHWYTSASTTQQSNNHTVTETQSGMSAHSVCIESTPCVIWVAPSFEFTSLLARESSVRNNLSSAKSKNSSRDFQICITLRLDYVTGSSRLFVSYTTV